MRKEEDFWYRYAVHIPIFAGLALLSLMVGRHVWRQHHKPAETEYISPTSRSESIDTRREPCQ